MLQFDRHGSRIWRQARYCWTPSISGARWVKSPSPAKGAPSRLTSPLTARTARWFRCIGCGYFRTDISYFPDLERYLADLLRQREKLRAVTDAGAWARAKAMLSYGEMTRIRRLISRLKGALDDLPAAR
jgi:hypothetical protein